MPLRQSRTALAQVTLTCSCELRGTYVPVCLFDRTAAGDESAWREYVGKATVSAVKADQGRLGAEVTNRKAAAARALAKANREAGRVDCPF